MTDGQSIRSEFDAVRYLPHIEDMSTEERLRLLEELWNSLSQRPENTPLTPEQREELDRRLYDLEREGPVGIPWKEVLRQIRSRPR